MRGGMGLGLVKERFGEVAWRVIFLKKREFPREKKRQVKRFG